MVSVLVNGVAVNTGNIPRPFTVVHGRSEIGFQPDPPSTEFEWWADTIPWTLGDDVKVFDGVPYTPATYDDPVATYDSPISVYDSSASGLVDAQHFGGTIAGIEATGSGGEVTAWRITAVGYQARWGVTPIKITRPAETDVARVQAIAAAAGYSIVIDGDPGVRLAAVTDLESDALSAVQTVCGSTGGLIWQDRIGRMHYTTAAYRTANQQPDVSVLPRLIVDDLAWHEEVEDLVNQVTVTYGPESARGESTAQDNASVAEPWGLRALPVDTQCETEVEAELLAALILARRAWPYWGSINALVTIDPPDEVLFSAADINTVMLLPIPRDPGPTPLVDPAPWVLEGWIETWTESMEHTATLAASDQRRWVTTTLRTYQQALDAGTYQHWLDQGSYIDLLVATA